jgi:hypothetical protein
VRIVNKKLGPNTMERVLRKKNGAEALYFLYNKMHAAGIDFRGWNREMNAYYRNLM